jgi:cephalosporin hydroxylase
MNLTVDNENRVLIIEDPSGFFRDLPLFSPEAFELLSREWMRIGWALQQYMTFSWFGRPILQLPEDLIRLQEVVFDLKPDLLIETGVCWGGSLLYHATLFEAIGKGRVVGVDIQIGAETREAIEASGLAGRIALVEADSASRAAIDAVRLYVRSGESVMVILDSNHSKEHVAAELAAYAPLVTPGSCMVVEDGIMRDLADVPGGEPGWTRDNPSEAAREFAATHAEFELREPRWKFNRGPLRKPVTYWPEGWLWRKA